MIILDQFEEYLIISSRNDSNDFDAELARAVQVAPESDTHFLISVREDWLAKLDAFKSRIYNLFDNLFRIEHLGLDEARAAIERPIQMYNSTVVDSERFAIDPDLVQRLIHDTSSGVSEISAGDGEAQRSSVEGPMLQLVLSRLWDEERSMGSRVLRSSTLSKVGGVRKILSTSVDPALRRLSRNQMRIAARLLRYLVTPAGAVITQREDDLIALADAEPAAVRSVLDSLAGADAHILIYVSGPGGFSSYRLSHSALAPPVLDWQRRFAQ
jgi:hypothetical protein